MNEPFPPVQEELPDQWNGANFEAQSPRNGETFSIPNHLGLLDRLIADRYQLVRCIGEGGGGGVVYEARDKVTFGRCALKLLTGVGGDPYAMRRFGAEARTTAQIESEHIVRVSNYGLDRDSGRPYIVMELLSGQDLRGVLKRHGRLEPAVAVQLVLQAAVGLSRAHQLGVVHRDVKPANLFLARRDLDGACVKVLDFGIAKVKAEFGLDLSPTSTRSGALIGTPRYMSPEQARGAATDARTDVWSLGVVLFEMISGKLPFPKDASSGETIAALLNSEPERLRASAPWAPPALARIVDTALSRDASERYANADVFRRALSKVASVEALPLAALLEDSTDPPEPTRPVPSALMGPPAPVAQRERKGASVSVGVALGGERVPTPAPAGPAVAELGAPPAVRRTFDALQIDATLRSGWGPTRAGAPSRRAAAKFAVLAMGLPLCAGVLAVRATGETSISSPHSPHSPHAPNAAASRASAGAAKPGAARDAPASSTSQPSPAAEPASTLQKRHAQAPLAAPKLESGAVSAQASASRPELPPGPAVAKTRKGSIPDSSSTSHPTAAAGSHPSPPAFLNDPGEFL